MSSPALLRALRRAREEGAHGENEKKAMRRMYEEVRIKYVLT